jgi:hypothetical protein
VPLLRLSPPLAAPEQFGDDPEILLSGARRFEFWMGRRSAAMDRSFSSRSSRDRPLTQTSHGQFAREHHVKADTLFRRILSRDPAFVEARRDSAACCTSRSERRGKGGAGAHGGGRENS